MVSLLSYHALYRRAPTAPKSLEVDLTIPKIKDYGNFLDEESQPTAGRHGRQREDSKQKVFSSLIGCHP